MLVIEKNGAPEYARRNHKSYKPGCNRGRSSVSYPFILQMHSRTNYSTGGTSTIRFLTCVFSRRSEPGGRRETWVLVTLSNTDVLACDS